jgi:hypothetical protein
VKVHLKHASATNDWRGNANKSLACAEQSLLAESLPLQEALRAMREQWKTSDQGGTPNHALWKRFDRETKRGAKMENWQALLEAGISGITGTALERNVDSLFTTGAPQGMNGASGLDDWEVIAWFPVLASE